MISAALSPILRRITKIRVVSFATFEEHMKTAESALAIAVAVPDVVKVAIKLQQCSNDFEKLVDLQKLQLDALAERLGTQHNNHINILKARTKRELSFISQRY